MLNTRRRRRERGAVAVEMAIVVPVLVLLAFGMLEFGLALKTKLTISQAVNQATRHATVLGTDDFADVEILDALTAGLSGELQTVDSRSSTPQIAQHSVGSSIRLRAPRRPSTRGSRSLPSTAISTTRLAAWTTSRS